MISENERCYIYLHREIRWQNFAWPLLALHRFCLSFSALRHGRKSWFFILWTKAHASLLLWYKIVWWWGRERRFEWVASAVITVDEDHELQFKNNYLKVRYCSKGISTCVFGVINAKPILGIALVSITWGLFNILLKGLPAYKKYLNTVCCVVGGHEQLLHIFLD